jgi:NADPH:quinone reductase-like Zn-dependent oxidoreductase
MKAIAFDGYGSSEVLRLEDVESPDPRPDEVRIRVRAASINPYDWHFMTGLPIIGRPMIGGWRSPTILRIGADVAGEVEDVGASVTRFDVGDEVFGMVNGGTADDPQLELGSCAEFVCVSERWLESMPEGLNFEEAAAVPVAAITALQGLTHIGALQAGQKVLINGASGGVGTYAVQIAKALGAEVTGVCSTPNLELVESIGADHVIDYTKDDFAARPECHDLLLDNVGNRSLGDCRRALTPDGTYLASFGQPAHRWVGPMVKLLRMAILNRFVSQTMIQLDQVRNAADLGTIAAMIEDGAIASIIDRTFGLDAVGAALDHLEQGHARGKVVITI